MATDNTGTPPSLGRSVLVPIVAAVLGGVAGPVTSVLLRKSDLITSSQFPVVAAFLLVVGGFGGWFLATRFGSSRTGDPSDPNTGSDDVADQDEDDEFPFDVPSADLDEKRILYKILEIAIQDEDFQALMVENYKEKLQTYYDDAPFGELPETNETESGRPPLGELFDENEVRELLEKKLREIREMKEERVRRSERVRNA